MCERSIVLPEVGRITGSFISVHMRESRNSSSDLSLSFFLSNLSNLIPAGVYICNWVIVMRLHCPAKSCAPKGCPGLQHTSLHYVRLCCVQCLVCNTHYIGRLKFYSSESVSVANAMYLHLQ